MHSIEEAMNRFRTIILLFALIAQALPVQAMMRVNASESCTMGCCAWLAEAGLSECGCEKTSEPVSPAKAPPTSSREWVPQLVWAEADFATPAARPPKALGDVKSPSKERNVSKQLHVRLVVLLCSFLN